MLGKTQMQEIQDLKLRSYTKTEIMAYYEQLGMKPPSRPTISKYYDMDVVPGSHYYDTGGQQQKRFLHLLRLRSFGGEVH